MVFKSKSYSTICFWISFGTIFLQSADTSSAYYMDESKNYESILEKSESTAQWNSGNRAFAVYDNFFHPTSKNSHGPVIFPASDKFVPVDVVDCNISVYNVLRTPLPAGYKISDLFYANLKFKIMQQEYEELQKRARKLSSKNKGNSWKRAENRQSGEESIERSNSKNSPADQSHFQFESIHELKQKLQRQSNIVIRHTSYYFNGKEEMDLENKSEAKESNSVVNQLAFPFGEKMENERFQPQGISKNIGRQGRSNFLGNASSFTLNHDKGRTLYQSSDKVFEVSRLLTLPGRIINYLITNKIEALFYGVLLFFVILMAHSLNPKNSHQFRGTE